MSDEFSTISIVAKYNWYIPIYVLTDLCFVVVRQWKIYSYNVSDRIAWLAMQQSDDFPDTIYSESSLNDMGEYTALVW